MRRILLLLTLAAAACSSKPSSAPSTDEMPALKAILDPKPANGYQIVLPIVKYLAPGTDNEVCTWTDLIVDHDVDIASAEGYQTVTGHHVILFSTTKMQPPGTTRTCTDDDMATFRFAVGAGGEGSTPKVTAPAGLVFHIPAGSQFVINHHYINATPNVQDAQSAVNIWLADPGTYTNVGGYAWLDTAMRIPPGQNNVDINCTMQNSGKVWQMFPHMHTYGTRITIQQITGGVTNTLFDVQQWSPEYQFHPPSITKDVSAPLILNAGDVMHVHCEYDNTTSSDITFGTEMCVGFSMTIDDQNLGDLDCDGGNWGDF